MWTALPHWKMTEIGWIGVNIHLTRVHQDTFLGLTAFFKFPFLVVFSDCGQTMACMASSNNITLHSTVLDKEKGYYFKPATHTIKFVQPVTCIAFGVSHYVTSYGIRRPDNIPIIASGHANGNIGIWHGVTSQLITRLLSHTGWVNQIEISPPANYHTQILSASQDRTVIMILRLQVIFIVLVVRGIRLLTETYVVFSS